jgi:hypothetical protein
MASHGFFMFSFRKLLFTFNITRWGRQYHQDQQDLSEGDMGNTLRKKIQSHRAE